MKVMHHDIVNGNKPAFTEGDSICKAGISDGARDSYHIAFARLHEYACQLHAIPLKAPSLQQSAASPTLDASLY